MADVIYNIEKLNSAKNDIDSLKTELNELNTQLNKSLTTLKEQWNTPAGKAFFENKQNDWSDDVSRYTTMLEGVSEMLTSAINEYELIDSEAEGLKF